MLEEKIKKIISELKAHAKTPLGYGMDHIVYPSLKDSSKVFKIAYSQEGEKFTKINNSAIQTFEAHPDIFPIVYRKGDKYVTLERLDTIKAEKEFEMLSQELEKDDELDMGNIAYTLFLIFRDNNRELENEIDFYFVKLPSPIPKIYKKWKNLLKKFFQIMPTKYYPDLHVGQFGYTKDNKLKILDF